MVLEALILVSVFLYWREGPNFSGKSVYIKQIGVITLLAHIGSYVPADDAVVALTDRIFTAINNVDSVSISQSTFAQDLSHVSMMELNLITHRVCR